MTREEAIKYMSEEQKKTEEVVSLIERDFGVSESVWHTEYEAFNLAIAALREQPQWISVKNQKPEYKKQVLFVDENKRVWLAKDSVDWPDGVVSFLEPESGLWVRGTHWMPLPEPPKED